MKLKLAILTTAMTLMFFVFVPKASAAKECEGSPVAGTIEKIQQTYANWSLCLGRYAVSNEEGSDKFYRMVEANFKNGVKHGLGKVLYSSGDKYVGNFFEDKIAGSGTLIFFSGDKYVGDFKDGKFDGNGTLTFVSGEKYVGDFKDGKYDGNGTLTFVSGDKYVGDFKDGKYDGNGTLTLEKGTTHTGIWASGTLVKSKKGMVKEGFENLTEKIPLSLFSLVSLIFCATLSAIFFETPRTIFLEEVQTFNKERSLTRIKTSVFVTSGFLCVPFGIWMLSEELLFGGSMILTICPCLFIYPMIRGLFFGGKDSFAAAATTVIVEEVTKAGISSAMRKMEERKKRKG